jgi:hypothetical protein
MNTVEQLILEHPALEKPRALLAHYQRTRTDHKVALRKMTPHLVSIKRAAVANGDQALAKAVWCLETVAAIQRKYLDVFTTLKQSRFYAAWCFLEGIEKTIHALSRHFKISEEYGLRFIQISTVRWQSAYPYTLFISPEFIKREVQCGICGAPVSLRKGCGHRVGEIYNGEYCFRKVTKTDFISISLVHNPVQKYSVLFKPDPAVGGGEPNPEAYPLARYIINGLISPWDTWAVEQTTIRHPHSHYSDVTPTKECPCVDPKGTYEQCCMLQDGVLRPHTIIKFSVRPPAKLMERVYI